MTYDQAKARGIVEQSIRKEAAAKNRSADLINACGSRAPRRRGGFLTRSATARHAPPGPFTHAGDLVR
ncbi:hypothetical protein [Streptomyces sp. NPDC101455]|uniref:hypothetical protein n=1 Tax=Streptomyces sp. NPDC101455 TaxID=3366142 RepID=UPI003825D5D6